MKRRILFLLVSIFEIINFAYAQKQNNQWRFGGAGAIDFNTVPPSFVNGCVIATSEGSASVADKLTGALLFYTDGVTVWNANNQVMPNGTGLLGGSNLLSSTTAAVIVPKPGSSNLYYIVTVHELLSPIGVNYSLVDMTLNGGLGDIVAGQQNIFLIQTGTEKLEVVPSSDGTGFWLLTDDFPGNSFYAFKISSTGIQNTPVVSTVGSGAGLAAGHMKINRQFNKIAIGAGAQIEVFDFDNATGILSNPIAWNVNLPGGLIYGIEFSPDGKVLYISDSFSIFQYDFTQTTPLAIQNSLYQIASQAGTLQLGIDNKIYVNTGCLSTINCPNNLGAACGYQTCVIANQTGGGGGLPKWVYYADDSPSSTSNSIATTDSCFGSSTQFSLQSIAGITNVNWLFGDPNSGANNTANGFNVSHSFSQIGTYNVRAILNNACGADTLFFNNLQIINCNVIQPTITGIKINGDTCNINTNFSIQAIGTSNSPYFFWDFGDPNSGTNDTITITGTSSSPFPTHTFTSPGIYNVCVSFKEPGLPVATICRTVKIGLCNVNPPPCIASFDVQDTCAISPTRFSIASSATINSVVWNFGDAESGVSNTSSLLNPTHQFTSEGNFTVTATIALSCGNYSATRNIQIFKCDTTRLVLNEIFVPEAFSPNSDGNNDNVYVRGSIKEFSFSVFNRWGEVVFKTENQNTGWDGTYKGKELNAGVYVFFLSGQDLLGNSFNKKGNITLVK
jgi:gliding motility-associated-like protein